MDTVDDMLDWVAEGTMGAPELWKHRAIVCLTNDDANFVNVQMQGKLSADETVDGAAEMFPDDYLHELHLAGLPPHRLRVKAGAVMILTRNIALHEDLCNGTRVYVLRTFASAVEVYVFRTGRTHFLPRLTATSADESGLPVVLYRTQVPLTYRYALTVHKSHGQSYNDRLGIFLSQPVFAHGHLHVAFSRAGSFKGVRMFMDPSTRHHDGTAITTNIVCKALLGKHETCPPSPPNRSPRPQNTVRPDIGNEVEDVSPPDVPPPDAPEVTANQGRRLHEDMTLTQALHALMNAMNARRCRGDLRPRTSSSNDSYRR